MSSAGMNYKAELRKPLAARPPTNSTRLVFRAENGQRVECRGHLGDCAGGWLIHVEAETGARRLIDLRRSMVLVSSFRGTAPAGRLISIETEAL